MTISILSVGHGDGHCEPPRCEWQSTNVEQ